MNSIRGLSRVALVVAAVWSLSYTVLALVWLLGGSGYPFDAGGEGRGHTLLDPLPVTGGSVAMLALALLGVAVSVATVGGRSGRVLAGLAAVSGLILAVVIPDVRVLMTMGYVPVMLVGALFGAADLHMIATMIVWPSVNLVILMVGGVSLMILSAHLWRRSGRSAPSAAQASRVGKVATIIAVAVPVVYASTRLGWLLGIPVGISQEFLDFIAPITPIGAGLATLGLGGAALTTGLVLPWGETWPRWIPVLRGRPIPPRFPVVWALAVAMPITSSGLMYIRKILTGQQMGPTGANAEIGAWLPEMLWPLWGAALAVAALAYLARRRVTERTPG